MGGFSFFPFIPVLFTFLVIYYYIYLWRQKRSQGVGSVKIVINDTRGVYLYACFTHSEEPLPGSATESVDVHPVMLFDGASLH